MFDGKNVAKTARTVPKAVLDTIQKQQETLKILEGKMDQLLNKGEKDSRHGKQQKKAK